MSADEAKEKLLELIKEGDTVYTILRHCSRNGMYRVISLVVIKDNSPVLLDEYAGELLSGYDSRHHGCKARGVGMDMGFALVSELSQELFGDIYKLRQKWL